jgi:gluconokinase
VSTGARAVVVMGVSGSGKSTLARALAADRGWRWLDADDFHSADARAWMAGGRPLTDAMREPWVAALAAELRRRHAAGEDVVLAYSGLRRAHRDTLRATGVPIRFLFLHGGRELIARRMRGRDRHFMPVDLLDSQFEVLQDPRGEVGVQTIDIDGDAAEVLARARAALE